MVSSTSLLKIVLIDDEQDLLETYEDGLMGIGGFEVMAFEDGVSAMRGISQFHPHIVVVDLNLPNIPTGTIVPLVRGLRSKRHAMEILILSGADNIEDIARMWQIPHYLKKPVTPQELAQKLYEMDPRRSI